MRRRGIPSEKDTSEGDGGEDDDALLFDWASHDDESFHDFEPHQADAIRTALLGWYRAKRRKLPWRGDAPPYDGSTAGSTGGTGKRAKKRVITPKTSKDGKRQKTVSDFFASSKKGNKGSKMAIEKLEVEGKIPPGGGDEEAEVKAMPVTAYGVWVSEIMLQQTRVEAVIPYYLKWMSAFPTVEALAEASEEEVNARWAGLGFYRRARMLHEGAKMVMSDFDGIVPSTVDDLLKITGIGQYTACAIASIAHGHCVPVVDGNVCRVLARLRGIAQHIKAPILKDKLGWRLAEQIVRAGDGKHAGEINQALMELGATYCAPSGTGTDSRDPLKDFYISTRLGRAAAREFGGDPVAAEKFVSATAKLMATKETKATASTHKRSTGGRRVAKTTGAGKCALCDDDGVYGVIFQICDGLSQAETTTPDVAAGIGHAAFPIPPPKKAKRQEVHAVAALCLKTTSGDVVWLMVKRPKKGLLAGQWEFPNVCVWSSGDENRKKRKTEVTEGGEVDVPFIDEMKRRSSLDSFLSKIYPSDMESDDGSSLESADPKSPQFLCGRSGLSSTPLEHIFSHVKHTMWVEYGELTGASDVDGLWVTSDGREVQWMSEEDMGKVGITSGVKKVLGVANKKLSRNNDE